jgi:hypothetical protein
MIALFLLACQTGPKEPDVPLDQVALDVLATLDLALDRASRGDGGATEDCARAYQRFEAELEPHLRASVPAADVLAIEYAFSRVRQALSEGRSAVPEVQQLAERLTAATGLPQAIAYR